MPKRLLTILSLVLVMVVLTGCGKKQVNVVQPTEQKQPVEYKQEVSDDVLPGPQPTQRQDEQGVDLSKIQPPNISGYEQPVVMYKMAESVGLSYSAIGGLSNKLQSVSASVDVRQNPDEPYDFSSFQEVFPLEYQPITIKDAQGYMGYQDISMLDDIVLTEKYETIQIGVVKGGMYFVAQAGHSNNNHANKGVYKQEAIKVLEVLIDAYRTAMQN